MPAPSPLIRMLHETECARSFSVRPAFIFSFDYGRHSSPLAGTWEAMVFSADMRAGDILIS